MTIHIQPELDAATDPMRGERALWKAVVTQALMDAATQSAKSEMHHEKHQALCWLTTNSRDFRAVCDFADLDPAYVRRRSRKALESGCNWRHNQPDRGQR